MDPHKIVAELRGRWQPFPSTSTLGSYDYFSQTIELAAVSREEMTAAFVEKDFSAQLKVCPLLVHEAQHLADHTATVWGRDLLVRLFDVYTVRNSDSLNGYDRIPPLMRELRTIHFADYYTEYSDLALELWDGKRWRYQFSAGAQLDANGRQQEDRPIVFTRFSRHDDDEHIVRVPFSVASLLEVRAMASEMLTATMLCMKKDGDPVAIIDCKNWAEKTSAMFYEPLLAIYTVAAHCYANKTKTGSDPLEVFIGASAIAWLALNLPREMFPGLRIPDEFLKWGARNEAMRANCDRGYLYLVLVQNITQTVGKGKDPAPMLDATLRSAGLPPLAEVLEAVKHERKVMWTRIAGSPFEERLKDLLTLGDGFAAREHLHPGRGFFLGSAPLPAFLLTDGSFTGFPSNTPTSGTFADPHVWLKRSHLLYLRLKEFFDACVA